MELEYFPNIGFKIDDILFKWNESRQSIRTKLNDLHKEDNRVIEMAEFFDGDEIQNILQRRDIYKDIKGGVNYFFLSYNEEDKLNEIEFHWGVKIIIDEIELNFEKDISQYVNDLKIKDNEMIELEKGNYLFRNLKITISNSESNGGEGNALSYFYASNSIEHLEE